MRHRRPTVADLLSMKGKRQLTMLRVVTLEEAEAAEKARIDLVSVPPALLGPEFREAAPSVFAFPGLEYGDHVTAEDYIRAAFQALKAGGDAVYCAASLSTVRRMREEGIPVCGHVGLIPSKATWTGGFRAVGKTAASALEVWRQTKALEEAGAFAAEIEVVPRRSRRRDQRAQLDGGGDGLRRAISLCRGRARRQSRLLSAPRQDLSQLRRRI